MCAFKTKPKFKFITYGGGGGGLNVDIKTAKVFKIKKNM